jgi:hypothetical protein
MKPNIRFDRLLVAAALAVAAAMSLVFWNATGSSRPGEEL